MKIEINYNGPLIDCYAEVIGKPGSLVNILDADSVHQDVVLNVFRTIRERVEKRQKENYYKEMPVVYYKRELQVTLKNLIELYKLVNEGVAVRLSTNSGIFNSILLELKDGTSLEAGCWLIQDIHGRWFGVNDVTHNIYKKNNKPVEARYKIDE